MFTDMVGYTALTQSNESQALDVLERHNRLLRPFFPRFNGREVKTIGDSFLVEFDSALDATNCALEIQRFLHDYNVSSRDEWKITLRIGIHLGDVVHPGRDVFGDAVNIASRLQPLAEPEGVCVSDQVYGQVRNKVQQEFVKIAPQDLKGVRFPVDVYRVVMPWEKEVATSLVRLDKNRIAVLPFANMSPDPADEYFADGLTEELIDRLSQVRGLEVIARTSVMSYKKKDAKAADIGRELRVGSLVEGSLRKAGNKIRVTAQLINSSTEGHLWSSRYDRDVVDIFAVQTDIAEQVAGALRVQLLPSERMAIERRRTQSMDAYTLYLKGRQLWNKRSKEEVEEALSCFNRALEIDPGFALAHVGIADCYGVMGSWGYAPSAEMLPRMKQSILKALELDSNLAEAHTAYAQTLAYNEWKWEEGEHEFKRAIELNPNYATAHHWYSYSVLRFARRIDEEMREAERALELDPLAPVMSWNMAESLTIQERYDEAIEWLERCLALDPGFKRAYVEQAYCYLMKGRHAEAVKLYETYLPQQGLPENRLKLTWVFVYGMVGREMEGRRLLADVMESSDKSITPTELARASAGLGEIDKMFEYLEVAYVQRDPELLWALIDPIMKPLKSDTRLQELKRKVGIG